MLLLPNGDGLVWVAEPTNMLYDLEFDSGAHASWAPKITSFPSTVEWIQTVKLTIAQLCGLSECQHFGDDNQQAENCPMVRFIDRGGSVTYARAHDVSTRSIAPGQSGSVFGPNARLIHNRLFPGRRAAAMSRIRLGGHSDISFAVIHKRVRRSGTARRSELVNNCAASHDEVGGRPALVQSRSRAFNPVRVTARLPAEPVALATTSNRKVPQEGHYIRAMDSRAKRRISDKHPKTMNEATQWQQHRAFGAVDWASEKHYVIVVDQAGKVIEEFQIEHSALGWKKFREKLQPYGSIPFAIETSQGAVVEQLLGARASGRQPDHRSTRQAHARAAKSCSVVTIARPELHLN
jgi:hypothetical protein